MAAPNGNGDRLDPRYLSIKNGAKRQRLLAEVNRTQQPPTQPIPGEAILTIGQNDGTSQFNPKER